MSGHDPRRQSPQGGTEKKKKSKENRKTASDVTFATMHVHVIVWFLTVDACHQLTYHNTCTLYAVIVGVLPSHLTREAVSCANAGLFYQARRGRPAQGVLVKHPGGG